MRNKSQCFRRCAFTFPNRPGPHVLSVSKVVINVYCISNSISWNCSCLLSLQGCGPVLEKTKGHKWEIGSQPRVGAHDQTVLCQERSPTFCAWPLTLRGLCTQVSSDVGVLLIFFIAFRQRKREGERKTSVCCSTYLCIHWLILFCTLTGDQGPNAQPGHIRMML